MLLNTLSELQTDCLNEMFFNIGNCCELQPEQRRRLCRDKKVIRSLSNIDRDRKKRRADLKRHQKAVVRILSYLAPQLQDVVTYSVRHGM